MAYSALPAKAAGDTITLTNYNAIKGNFEAGVPDIFTAAGDIAVAVAPDEAVPVAIGADGDVLIAEPGSMISTLMAWWHQPAARVYNDADFDPTPSTWTTVTFNTERYDTDAMHSTVSNTSRLTIPGGCPGYYNIGACIEFATGIGANASSDVGVRILLNGATVIAQDMRVSYRAGTYNLAICITTEYALVATDWIEVQVYTSQDVNVTAASNYSPEFWAIWERKQTAP